MNLHQFRFVQEAARRNLNLTETAKALHTSQPGVSKAIIELEEELGIEIFARHGKRLKRITEPGQHVLQSIQIILREVNNLRKIGDQYSAQDNGTLSIATTHTQARYVLPMPVAKLREKYPKVNISLHQGAPDQVAKNAAGRHGRNRHRYRITVSLRGIGDPALLRVATRFGLAAGSPFSEKRASVARGHCQ
jgi:LysR family cys regulon transcriptional activator